MRYHYKGIPCFKSPFDMALYQQLIWTCKPKTIIEIGSAAGGSAVWFADIVDTLAGGGHVYSLDIHPVTAIEDERITFMTGNAREPARHFPAHLVDGYQRPILVIDDSDHSYETTSGLLAHFDPLIRPGEFVVIEDGIVDHMPAVSGLFNGGPNRAIQAFLRERGQDWIIDRSYCDFYGYNVTWNTNGFLMKCR